MRKPLDKETKQRRKEILLSALLPLISLFFAAYNLVLGAIYDSLWFPLIAVYFILLLMVRLILFFGNIQANKLPEDEKEERKKSLFSGSSILIFLVDLSLIAPLAVMVYVEKEVSYGLIAAIGFAAYTVFKVVLSVRGFIKSRKKKDLIEWNIATTNIIDAIVSVLSLQYALIMIRGGFKDTAMLWLNFSTTVGFTIFIFVFSVVSYARGIKTYKKKQASKVVE